MQFVVAHEFAVAPSTLVRAMFNPAYLAYLGENHGLLMHVTEQARSEEGGRLVRSVRYAPKPAFEQIGPKKLDPEWFEFIDESSWDPETQRLTFAHVPLEERVRRRLSTRGEVRVEGIAALRTRRTTRADIEVRDLPFMLRPFSALAEKKLLAEALRMVEAEAETMARFLREYPAI